MEWKWNKILAWNGRFLVWNGNGMEEICQYGIWKNRLPFHTMPCLQLLICNRLRNFQIIVLRNQLRRIVIYELQIIEPWLATTIG